MDDEARAAGWAFIGVLGGFKVGTGLLIFSLQPSVPSAAFLLGVHWYWVLVPLVALGVPTLFWLRLVRVRAKREWLIRAEWLVEPGRRVETWGDAWQNVVVDNASRAAIWTLIAITVAFKVVTSVVIFMMQPSGPSAAFLIGMHWLWFVAPFLVLGLPSLFWYRLMRVRAKRRQLILQEWRVQSELDWTPAMTHGRMREP